MSTGEAERTTKCGPNVTKLVRTRGIILADIGSGISARGGVANHGPGSSGISPQLKRVEILQTQIKDWKASLGTGLGAVINE